VIVLAVALAGTPVQAASCGDLVSTPERQACFGAEWQRADRRLNVVYQALIKHPSLDPQGQTLLRTAQRAWLAFRDAQCAWDSDEMRGGTEASVLTAACLATLTADRVRQLEADLKGRGN
jgi:uncharacterized protein YecT (DUF1311 family)